MAFDSWVQVDMSHVQLKLAQGKDGSFCQWEGEMVGTVGVKQQAFPCLSLSDSTQEWLRTWSPSLQGHTSKMLRVKDKHLKEEHWLETRTYGDSHGQTD